MNSSKCFDAAKLDIAIEYMETKHNPMVQNMLTDLFDRPEGKKFEDRKLEIQNLLDENRSRYEGYIYLNRARTTDDPEKKK
jgi:hypothetical protein